MLKRCLKHFHIKEYKYNEKNERISAIFHWIIDNQFLPGFRKLLFILKASFRSVEKLFRHNKQSCFQYAAWYIILLPRQKKSISK